MLLLEVLVALKNKVGCTCNATDVTNVAVCSYTVVTYEMKLFLNRCVL